MRRNTILRPAGHRSGCPQNEKGVRQARPFLACDILALGAGHNLAPERIRKLHERLSMRRAWGLCLPPVVNH